MKTKIYKNLVNGVAVIAALAFSAPVWAQPANPSGGNGMGMPGPNPGGGGGLTPYSTGTPPLLPRRRHRRHRPRRCRRPIIQCIMQSGMPRRCTPFTKGWPIRPL